MKEKTISRIIQKYNNITGINDLIGDSRPSALFGILANIFSYVLSNNTDDVISSYGVQVRRVIHPLITTFGKLFLTNPQVIENRNFLLNPQANNIPKDNGITLPPEPVIWVANHGFKDDIVASILAAKRHSYLLLGSLPHFYNTIDAVTSWLNGVVLINRKSAESRHSIIAKAVQAIEYGADFLIFPEGVWNKTPNRLLLDFFPGVYTIACETGAKIAPIIHYIRDSNDKSKSNLIHTVVDKPIRIDDLSEKAALELLREIMGTWLYLMMETYGKSTRDAEIPPSSNFTEVWSNHLTERIKTATYLDSEIETRGDFRSKEIIHPEDVWRVISDMPLTKENAASVIYANQIVAQIENEDFQHKF